MNDAIMSMMTKYNCNSSEEYENALKEKGYIIRFIMPAHDIEVYCNEKNLMVCCQAIEI